MKTINGIKPQGRALNSYFRNRIQSISTKLRVRRSERKGGLKILFIALFTLGMNISCSSQASGNEEMSFSQTDDVYVYYFHFSRRCMTCQAVEDVSKNAVAELYGDKVSFEEFNLDEEAAKAKADELEISGQSLVIISGDAKINITNEAFMNARTNPGKLKQIIKEKIDPLL